MAEPMTLLHIYGQEAWHDNVRIIGNRKGLEELYHAIYRALIDGKSATSECPSDGEGYGVNVVMNNSDWMGPFWAKLRLPYWANYAVDGRPEKIEPEEAEAQI